MLLRMPHLQDVPPASPESSLLLCTPPSPLRHSPTPSFLQRKRPSSLVRVCASAPTSKTVPNSVIRRIADKLRSLGYLDDRLFSKEYPSTSAATTTTSGGGGSGEIFVPVPQELPKYRVGHTLDPSWGTPEQPIPGPGTGTAIQRFHQLRREVQRQRKDAVARPVAAVPMQAELMIERQELRRLRTEGIRLDKKVKVGKAGITEGIVNAIHERWRKAELVKIKCDDLCRENMKRTHEILERKTGGLVVWRSGSIIVLYRGANYKYPYFIESIGNDDAVSSVPKFNGITHSRQDGNITTTNHIKVPSGSSDIPMRQALVTGVGSPRKVRLQLPGEAELEEEANRLLDGLGPRFIDWWGCEPLPVDADLLPAVVPGFRRPFRLLPYGVKPKLTDDEMTTLRRLSHPLPCHFALGRNRNLQGLAVSMLKLWEKCEIAKIAIKRGVQNTNSELMVDELKRLTGGILLSRDKEFITFYRGKDFLPPAVSKAIAARRDSGVYKTNLLDKNSSNGATFSVKDHAEPSLENGVQETNTQEMHLSHTKISAETVDAKLTKAYGKKMKAQELLEELEESACPLEGEPDREAISEEERFVLRKIGLRMKPFLCLGRRGVFDGTVENMHLHWKYRELVKIIAKSKSIEDVHRKARVLEAASGGILVAVERVNKGHAIIVYRGKNYQRPKVLRPKALLNKKEALKLYLQRQRCESLGLHVLKLSREIEQQKDKVLEMKEDCQADDMQPNKTKDLLVKKLEFGISKIDHLKSPVNYASAKTDLISSENEYKLSEEKDVQNTSHADQKEGIQNTATSIFSEDSFVGVAHDKHNSSEYQIENKHLHGSRRSFKDFPLSNKERLILRKQALQMKKRPVLSVGRNNAVNGVAKTIRTHFKKNPLAIVNIKNIAEGTSVQEVIFELERATGAVLVSREPNKVILYRGWGIGEEPCVGKGKRTSVGRAALQGELPGNLIIALKTECGLWCTEEDNR